MKEIDATNYMLHLEGMDLAGKSTISKIFSETSNNKWVINDKKLTNSNKIYDFALKNFKNYDSETLGFLYLASLLEDIKTFKLNKNIIQDSTLLLKSLNYYKLVDKNIFLEERFMDIAKIHPLPNKSFYLTCSMEVRTDRLQKRIRDKSKEITKIDRMIIDEPKKFIDMENSLRDLSIQIFNSKVIDSSEMNEFEVVDIIRKSCFI